MNRFLLLTLFLVPVTVLAAGCDSDTGTPPIGTDPPSDSTGTPVDSSALLIGAWRLEATQAFNSEGTLVYEPEVQTGFFVFTERDYSLMWTRAPRPPAAVHWNATNSERLNSFNTLIAHAGHYAIVNGDIVYDPLVAKSPEFVGGSERFEFAVSGDTLRMTAVDAESFDGTRVPFYVDGGRQDYRLVRVK